MTNDYKQKVFIAEYAARFGAIAKTDGLELYLQWVEGKSIERVIKVLDELEAEGNWRQKPRLPALKRTYSFLYSHEREEKRQIPDCRDCGNTGRTWCVVAGPKAAEIPCHCVYGARAFDTAGKFTDAFRSGTDSSQFKELKAKIERLTRFWQQVFPTEEKAKQFLGAK